MPISKDTVIIKSGSGGGGTTDHQALTNRDAVDCHPVESITGAVTLDTAQTLTGDKAFTGVTQLNGKNGGTIIKSSENSDTRIRFNYRNTNEKFAEIKCNQASQAMTIETFTETGVANALITIDKVGHVKSAPPPVSNDDLCNKFYVDQASAAPSPRTCECTAIAAPYQLPTDSDDPVPMGNDRVGLIFSVADNSITGLEGDYEVTIQARYEVENNNGRVRTGYEMDRGGVTEKVFGEEIDVDRERQTVLTPKVIISGALPTDKYRLTQKDDGFGDITIESGKIFVEKLDCAMF